MAEETVPQMRERIETLEKDLASEQKARAEAESKARLFEARDVFRGQGYNPKHADLYVGNNPEGEITVESVSTFADSYGLAPVKTDTGGAPSGEAQGTDGSTQDDDSDLAGLGGAGSGAGDGGAAAATQETLTHEEWMALNATDPVAAREKARRGLVEFMEGNFYAKQFNR